MVDVVMDFTLRMITGNWDDRLNDTTSDAFKELADDFLNLVRFTCFHSSSSNYLQAKSELN